MVLIMTINELAKLAQTSPATVSLALNNRPGVSPVTRQRILDIAASEGYISRKREIAPDKKIIKLIAVSKPNTSDVHNFRTSFFADIINWVQKRCSQFNYSMLYSIIPHNDFIATINSSEAEQPSDGIILLGTYLDGSEVDSLTGISTPLVVLDRNCTLSQLNSVGINNYMGAYVSVSSLIELGHRHIGYVSSSSSVANLTERNQGFTKALSDQKLTPYQDSYFHCNSYISDGVRLLGQQLAKCRDLPTAFFCENDYNALCLISALAQLGLRTPEDISVIGFDDVPECIIASPQLTTVHVNRKAMAYTAVELLHSLISDLDADATKNICINVRLVKRASTCPPSSSRTEANIPSAD